MAETSVLQSTLDAIIARLASLESKVGIQAPASVSSTPPSGSASSTTAHVVEDEDPPALVAYDEHVTRAVTPFVNACLAIDELKDTGNHIKIIWDGIRDIVKIGTKCKKPTNVQEALMPHLRPVQDAMNKIRTARLDRKVDWHIKALMEMLTSISWVVMQAPPAPSTFIKDTIGSSDYWANKIRKEYKGKDEAHIQFCETMKALISDLSAYVKEYHLSGLMWNPKGIAIDEYKAGSSNDAPKVSVPPKKEPAVGAANLMKELASKRTQDGSSAATGLKKVTRDQQTWRKEFKADKATPTVPTSKPLSTMSKKAVTTVKKDPVCKFQSVGNKWVVEYQTKDSNPNGLCVIEVKDPKDSCYIYKCENATIQIKGKLKSVIFDSCVKCNLLFETAISSCEVVNCKRAQIQSTGVSPSFSIDKTDGCLVYLSQEAVTISNFVTSKSSEMNVSWFDENAGEQKEAPLPEQFVHKLVNGSVTSDVSDLYH